jgi:hypothetical protein
MERLNQQEARQVATRIYDAIERGKTQMAKAQETMKRNVNRHRRPVDFGPGDDVYVSTKNWRME